LGSGWGRRQKGHGEKAKDDRRQAHGQPPLAPHFVPAGPTRQVNVHIMSGGLALGWDSPGAVPGCTPDSCHKVVYLRFVRYPRLSFDNPACVRSSSRNSDLSTYLLEYASREQRADDSHRMLTTLCPFKYQSGQLPARCVSATPKTTRLADHVLV
jgi:hypothetical protein